jgi:hypothetical protein
MKQKLLTRLVLGAVGSAAALAAGTAGAGQIQASSVSIAREVIITNAQRIKAPQVAYRFAGDVDARTQTQTFQVQLELKAGTWGAVGDQKSISVTDGIDGVEINQTPFPGAAVPGTYQVLALGRSTDNKTLYATIELAQRPGPAVDAGGTRTSGLVKQPIIGFNSVDSAAAGRALPISYNLVNGLFDVVGAVTECDLSNRNLDVEVFHYKALSTPTAIANTTNAQADEHTRSGSTNKGTIIVFPTNIRVNVVTSTGKATVRPNSGNVKFTNGGDDITQNATFVSTNFINTGYFNYSQFAQGYDNDTVAIYALNDADVVPGIVRPAAAVEPTGNVPATSGNVEARRTVVTVTASQGFAGDVAGAGVNSAVGLYTAANCTGLIAFEDVTARTATTATVRLDTQALISAGHGATGDNKIYVCYLVDGNTFIPQSAFSGVVLFEKQTDGLASTATTRFQEQNNSCKGPLYALGGGVKIDVRNYGNSKTPGGWLSVLRIINNSETLTADVTFQIIEAGGGYGPWGVLPTALGPRQAVNIGAAAVDALLTNAATNAAGIGTYQQGAATVTAGSHRLRISSANGATLRVQNYLVSPTGQVMEVSSSQGVDFQAIVNNQSPTSDTALDQDAQQGISK